MWTVFSDGYSGGSLKTNYQYICIEADRLVASYIFKDLFEYVDPEGESCPTCGSNYSLYSFETKEKVDEFLKQSKKSWSKLKDKDIFMYPQEKFTEDQQALVKALPLLEKIGLVAK